VKPRIRPLGLAGMWKCEGHGGSGVAQTPCVAYAKWKADQEREAVKRASLQAYAETWLLLAYMPPLREVAATAAGILLAVGALVWWTFA
jgi:hypothetical protein